MKKCRKFTAKEVETIKKYYKTIPISDIAEMLDRDVRVINHKMKALGLTGKPNDMILKREKKWKELEDLYSMQVRDLLYSLYWIENKSLLEISDMFDMSNRTVNSWMEVLEIPRRDNSDGTKVRFSKMTNDELIKHMEGAREGHKHVCSLVYTEDRRFLNNKEWKTKSSNVKNRDNYQCTECGLTEEENRKLYKNGLNVHHVIPYHICRKHEESNLITLCNACHLKLHRKYWWDEVREQKRLLELEKSEPERSSISQF